MKLSMNDLKNITPVGEKIKLSYEQNYDGNTETIEVTVYPLKVKEKIDIQKYSDELGKLVKLNNRTEEQDKQLIELNRLVNLKYAYYTMQKNIPDITEEFIEEKFPQKWYRELFEATLRAEGINIKDLDKEKNL